MIAAVSPPGLSTMHTGGFSPILRTPALECTKPFLTFEQQADILMRDRGMVADRDVLVRHLQDVGYYRLGGYWHIHKKRGTDEFWEGTTFDHVWELLSLRNINA